MNRQVCLFLILWGLAQGCTPTTKVKSTFPNGTRAPGFSQSFINDIKKKIAFFNNLLETDMPKQDRKIARDLLDTYQEIKALSFSDAQEKSLTRGIQKLCTHLSFFEKKYFSSREETANFPKVLNQLAQQRNRILDAYISENYQQVINLCIELKNTFGPDSLTPDIGALFALALSKKEFLDEAIQIGEGVAQRLEPRPDLIRLRIEIAEWYLQQGNLDQAGLVYEKLADTLDEKEISVLFLKNKISDQQKNDNNSGTIPEQGLYFQKEKSVDQLMVEIEKFLEENRFAEARNLLFAKKRHVGSSSAETEVVNKALKRVARAEERYLEEKISLISRKNDMAQTRKLLRQERLEEAIARLQAMAGEPTQDPEIAALKKFAEEKLINRERNRAAQIYLKTQQTSDPDIKEKGLEQCLHILKDLVDKYPASPLIKSVISHIETVNSELKNLPGENNAF